MKRLSLFVFYYVRFEIVQPQYLLILMYGTAFSFLTPLTVTGEPAKRLQRSRYDVLQLEGVVRGLGRYNVLPWEEVLCGGGACP